MVITDELVRQINDFVNLGLDSLYWQKSLNHHDRQNIHEVYLEIGRFDGNYHTLETGVHHLNQNHVAGDRSQWTQQMRLH